MIAALVGAITLGLLTAISPCPLATNIAAVSFIGRHAGTPARSLRAGLAYTVGRTLCYLILAAVLASGLLAATTASTFLSRFIGVLVGPVLIIAGAMLLGLVSAPSIGIASTPRWERLASRGDALSAFLLGIVFALSFCPSSAALFFGGLLPLAAKTESVILVPASYGVATGLPVLVLATLIAAGGHSIGRVFDRLTAVEKWLRVLTGAVLIGVGLYLCGRTIFGF